jgi:hypothetical protein
MERKENFLKTLPCPVTPLLQLHKYNLRLIPQSCARKKITDLIDKISVEFQVFIRNILPVVRLNSSTGIF